MSTRLNRSGFALPMALVIIVFLTVGVATAFTLEQSEMRADRDRESTSDAFAYAESGLEQYAMNRVKMGFDALNPAVWESTRVAMPMGHADVISRQVRAKSTTYPGVFLIRSRGFRSGGATALAGSSTHTVTQYAIFREGEMDIISAWTSLSGLLKQGDQGILTGVDACGVEPDVSGVAVPDAEYVQNGGLPVPTGSPPIGYLGNQTQTNDAVTVDWDGIVNHDLIWPDLRYPTQPWPSWVGRPDWYPVIRIDAATLTINSPMSGQGIIIATGDLVLQGDMTWNGIILVGGVLTSNGENVVHGAVISGLNEKLPGMTVPSSSIGNGEKYFYYDSCEVAKALGGQSAMILLGKTWADSWPSY